MTDKHRAVLRSIMTMAWASQKTEPNRQFGDCLKGAWKFLKRLAKSCRETTRKARANGGIIRLTNDLTYSPIRRSLIGQRYAGFKVFGAAYHTAVVGR